MEPPPDLHISRSRSSVEAPLLGRTSSEHRRRGSQTGETFSQKIYIVSEDVTAVIAGFSTSTSGYAAYMAICLLSGGLGYLLLRWMPRWRVRLIGNPESLRQCQWAAIEVN
jgi:cation-transporting ATPase 13A3/4/5